MKHDGILALLGLLAVSVKCSALYRPVSYVTGLQKDPLQLLNDTVLKLSSDGITPAIVVLDYGRDVEGYATFQVSQRSGDTSAFEMTYSESHALLDSDMGDGPLPLAAAMDTNRVNRYNITDKKSYTNRLIQGGLRYQKLNLSSAGEIFLSSIGLEPSVSRTPLTELPGSFNCSDPVLTRIWHAGARTLQLSEVPAHSVPDFWILTSEGALVDSLAPQPYYSIWSPSLTSYELQFSVTPISQGFGFTVLSDTLSNGIYIFVNIANASISAHAGSSELGTTLASGKLPASITLNSWHKVKSTVNLSHVSISINNLIILDFSQTASFYGSFSVGASLGHAAIFTNLSLSVDGQQRYSSTLKDKAALQDFLLGTNPLPVSVDGSRRDRIAYAGDLDMSSSTAFASTNGLEFINGSIELLGSYQLTPGFFVPNAKIQQFPRTTDVPANITGLIDYSFSLVSAMAKFYEQTGDSVFLARWAPKAARMLDWAHSQTLPNGLLNITDPSMGGDWDYYDPTLSGVVSKFNIVYAYSLKQWLPHLSQAGLNGTVYRQRLQSLQRAINDHLWSDKLQAYYQSATYQDFFSQEANALAILSDTTSSSVSGSNNRTAALLSTMARELSVLKGALAFSNASVASGWAQKISPYASGYHLKAAFHAHDGIQAKRLLHSLWGPISDPAHANYTGCIWETMNMDGTPGLGSSTSLCHAWGAGPTADLSRYVLGIQPVTPGFKEWKVAPQTLDLSWAAGDYPTPRGPISVDWFFDCSGRFQIAVRGPTGTKGTVFLPSPLNGTFEVQDGKTFRYRQ
ncbi:putative alpha-L-rhamnosidase C [Aspergillus homomorphus CBS 101889]|uniref:Putative alpha-L-rhamnosidase C n=1 Tax=Aspergillus homomorphus (strain CBS 101889) TaxID=1450537 RepID=A0A395I7Z4_ASPHC|nr:putative alpha-L-rhamnosidase C [Aspergillus homomorphus CBS 101889]RAL14294.1 putative alpha-L-rhamnosidase C [Aspergillus homomorphus CBS 101889]